MRTKMKTKFRPHGQKQKTNGQKLYEHVNSPPLVLIRVGWDFLSEGRKQAWEKQALEHHMFTK